MRNPPTVVGHAPQTAECPVYSVVIPFFNEQDAAPGLLQETLSVVSRLQGSFECLCIDDASSDKTPLILNSIAASSGSLVRVITSSRNRGQAAALWRGLREAKGSIIITMDGDGQNDPADIPRLLDALASADMVVGVRQHRQDSALRRWMSRLANSVRGYILRDGMRDSGCALKVFRREVIGALIPIRTLYSFMPAMAASAGFRLCQVPTHHRERVGGRSNYGLVVFLWRPLLDLLGMWWYTRRTFSQFDQISTLSGGQR